MKRKLILILFIIISNLLIESCKNCPPDEYLGQVNLSSSTLCFFPYDSNDTILIFMNSIGQVISLKSKDGKVIKRTEIVVDKPCAYELIDETNITMTIERQEILFENDSIKISLVVQISRQNLIQDSRIDTNWVETAFGIIGNSYDNLNNKLFSIITYDRGKEITQIEFNSFLYSETLNLLGHDYTNVYSDSLGQDIFFNKEIGIFGFRYNNLLYALKNE